MKIKEITIENFWKRYHIKWDINPDINILTGINGAGKSTVLDLIACIITGGKIPRSMINKASIIKIKFDEDDTTITNINFDDSFLNLTKQAQENEDLRELQEDVETDFSTSHRKTKLNSLMLRASISSVKGKTSGKMPIQDFLSKLNVNIISTFDEPISDIIDENKWDVLHEEGVLSTLDKELHDLQEKYSYYIGNLANVIEKKVAAGDILDSEIIRKLYEPKNLFLNIINELFAPTGKIIDSNNSKISFIISDTKKEISIYQLSSGEKQMLYILWTVLLQNREPFILFLDEPEISLHVDWQEVLLQKIKQLNPNCQILLATHAPSILLDGWQPYVVNIDDIKIENI